MIPILLTVVLFAQLAPSSSAALHFQAGLVRSKQAEPDRDRHRGIQQAISLEPSNPASYVELGQAYMKASRYGEAVPVLNRALELGPDLLTAHRLLGYALLTQGYAADACPHLEQAGDRGALGSAQIETNKFADAAANLQAALAATPDDPDLLYYLGQASHIFWREPLASSAPTLPSPP